VERIDPAGELQVNEEAASFASRIDEAITLLGRELGAIPGVFLENKRWTLSVHYRRADRAHVPGVDAAVQAVAARLSLHVMHGKEIVELRPPVTINKGTAIVELARITGVFDNGSLRGSLLYAGDDRTDEDAFRVLRERSTDSVTIHVGHLPSLGNDSSATVAEFAVPDPSGLRQLLEWLLRVR
jgi:trehalose-phosphatase